PRARSAAPAPAPWAVPGRPCRALRARRARRRAVGDCLHRDPRRQGAHRSGEGIGGEGCMRVSIERRILEEALNVLAKLPYNQVADTIAKVYADVKPIEAKPNELDRAPGGDS